MPLESVFQNADVRALSGGRNQAERHEGKVALPDRRHCHTLYRRKPESPNPASVREFDFSVPCPISTQRVNNHFPFAAGENASAQISLHCLPLKNR